MFSKIFVHAPSETSGFQQPLIGPGSATYQHDSVSFYDYAKEEDGYWLFLPASPTPQKAEIVVFLHGYAAINPMIYGQWIRHIVRQGNIVIYPRYQQNIISPSPKKFSENVVTGIQNALKVLESEYQLVPNLEGLCIVGHSYGGIIGADISVNWETYKIPKPKGLFAGAPGTGPLKAGRLESYAGMPSDLNLLVMIHENDYVVGDEMGVKIIETAINTPNRNLIRQFADSENGITAGHNETYCIDPAFDCGISNVATQRAYKTSKTNAVDYYGYWKLFDALMDCSRNGKNCDYAFGNTPQQRSLGATTEGKMVKELEVLVSF